MSGSSSPPGGSAKARLFVALDLPGAVVEALVEWRAPLLRSRRDVRPVAAEALHVTLAFLGWRAQEAIAPLTDVVEACAAGFGGVTGLALGEPLLLPRRRPRVLAVALEDRHGTLVELQSRLVARLAAGGWHEPEARPYLPHVTVARARGRDGISVSRAVELPRPEGTAFEGAAVTLYRSRLHPGGARYEPLFVRGFA